jgi:outer membrane usher protein
VDPALLIALQSLTTPEWFPATCQQPATPGYAVVAVHDTPRMDAIPSDAVIWVEPDGEIWAREQDLSGWIRGELPPSLREKDGTRWYRLGETPLPYRFDPCGQVLWIAPPRDNQLLSYGGHTSGTLKPAQASGFVNLDLFAVDGEHVPVEYAGLADIGLAHGFGSVRSAWSADGDATRRLDSYFNFDDPERLHRLRIGDAITRIDGLGTAVRYGGVRWGTDFSLQPEVPRFALPGVSGEAALPSTVELYVDGQLRDRREVDPGPFTVHNPPVFTGGGNLQVVVRDTLGRETVYVQPFYVSSQSLGAGVSDYAIEAGRLRENFATADDKYTDNFALGSYRYGVSDQLTLGTRLELQDAARTLGGSVIYSRPRIGQLNASLSGSSGDAGNGAQLGLGFERVVRGMNLGLQGSWSNPDYVELGREPGAVARSLRARAGFALPASASLSVAWAEEIRRDRSDLQLTALTYSQPVLGWYGSASWLHSPQAGDSVVLGASRALASGRTLSLQIQRDDAGDFMLTLTWQRSPQGPLGWHALASASAGDIQSTIASLAYTTARGNTRLTAAAIEGARSLQAELNTGLAWVGSDAYWTRPVRESFAIADATAPGVRIYRDNQLIGTTGANGRTLVPDIITYNTTRISLDTEDLPLDRGLTEASQDIKLAPGGAVITLATPARRMLQLTLMLDSGAVVPMGAQLRLDDTAVELPVGMNGLVYLETPAQQIVLHARWDTGRCQTAPINTHTLSNSHVPEAVTCHLKQ